MLWCKQALSMSTSPVSSDCKSILWFFVLRLIHSGWNSDVISITGGLSTGPWYMLKNVDHTWSFFVRVCVVKYEVFSSWIDQLWQVYLWAVCVRLLQRSSVPQTLKTILEGAATKLLKSPWQVIGRTICFPPSSTTNNTTNKSNSYCSKSWEALIQLIPSSRGAAIVVVKSHSQQ